MEKQNYRSITKVEEDILRSYNIEPDKAKEYHDIYGLDDIKEFIDADISPEKANPFAKVYSQEFRGYHIIEAIKKGKKPDEIYKESHKEDMQLDYQEAA